MFSFLMGVMTAIQTGKKKLSEKSNKLKDKKSKLDKHIKGEETIDSAETGKNTVEKKGIKTQLMYILTTVVLFFEMLPLFFSLMTWGIIFLCIVILVVIIFMLMAVLAALKEEEEEDEFKYKEEEVTEENSCGPTGGTLSWTDAEFASRGLKLTDYEKNLYRLGILARKAAEGYGGGELMVTEGATLDMRVSFLMGVASTETSMRFYSGGANHDIMKVPSTIASNSSGYGFMGIGSSKTLQSYYSSSTSSAIKSQYSPSSSPAYAAAYAPYGVAMSAKHHQNDFKANTSIASTKSKINKIAGEWGIVANVKEFSAMTQFFLAQAEYHGASRDNDYDGLINFYAALFVATSDKDNERSFSKWALKISDKNDFSESGIRNTFVGSGGKNSLDGKASAASLSGVGTTKILLNGKELTQPVWGYLGSKYGSNSGFAVAWSEVKRYSAMSGFISDRVLNFHYGFNSYIQAKRIESILAQKMAIVGTSQKDSDCGDSSPEVGGDETLGGKIARSGEKWIGIPYSMSTPRNISVLTPGKYDPKTQKHTRGVFIGSLDCSLFTQTVFKEFNMALPRTTREQVKSSQLVTVTEKLDYSKMQKGDIIYFWGSYYPYKGVYDRYSDPKSATMAVKMTNTTHVGIYWGDGMMIHTGNNRDRVNVQKLGDFWEDRFVVVKRHKDMAKGVN